MTEETHSADSTARPLLLSGNPLLQRLFAGPYWVVGLRLMAPGAFVMLMAFAFGVASIPVVYSDGHPTTVGIFWQPNWSLLHVIVVPMLLLAGRRLSEHIEKSLLDLEEMGVFVAKDSTQAGGLLHELTARIRASAPRLVLIALIVTVAVTVVDASRLFSGYFTHLAAPASAGPCAVAFDEMDWAVAFQPQACWGDIQLDPGFQPRNVWANLVFTTLAYSLQTLVILLTFIWLGKVAQFFFFLSSSIRGSDRSFTIEPVWEDPVKRLGLTPLGDIYNIFLTMILVFEMYVAAHRIQQIALVKGITVWTYFQGLVQVVSQPSRWFDPEVHGFVTADIGTQFGIVGISLPVLIVCWFPLFRIRQYLQDRKTDLSKEYAIRRKQAREAGQKEEADDFARRAQLLEEANVWPNGDKTAQRFLIAMIVIWIGAVVPIAFVTLALALAIPDLVSIIATAVERIFGRKSAPTAS